MRVPASAALAALLLASPVSAQQPAPQNPQIDYPGFLNLAREVEPYRAARLLPLGAFLEMAARDDVLLLDARSARDFAEGHIDGAVNLPLPQFTAASLAEAIGTDTGRPILIYCNNNFSNNVAPVVRKSLELALNIQTMINLYGYGYRNIYELGEVVDFTDPEVNWTVQRHGEAG